MSADQQLSTVSERQLAAPEKQLAVQEPSILEIIDRVSNSGMPPEQCVAILERLAALKEREDEKKAAKDFSGSFADLQSEVPIIHAFKGVPGKDGRIKYYYAPYEAIMAQVQPLLSRHGFSISFDTVTSEDGKRVTVTCTLRHRSGHKEKNSYTGRIGQGPIHASESQADGAGYTYAKRYCLCACLNIADQEDTDGRGPTDARNLGDFIPADKAAELQARAEACGPTRKLLEWLGAESWEKIYSTRLEDAEREITKREAKKPDLARPYAASASEREAKKPPLARPEDPDIEF